MDTVDIISSYCLVNNSVYQGPSFISHCHLSQYLCALQYCSEDQAIFLSCCLIPYCPQGIEKSRLVKLMTSFPFCHCPLPGSLAILNWLIAEIPALKQCSVRKAADEKIILIWASELIMYNTVSSFHNKFITLQQFWIEMKSFPLCLFKDNMYPSHL